MDPWIKMRMNLRRVPEVIAVAEQLGERKQLIVGCLHTFWSWAETHTADGHARSVTKTYVDELVALPGFAAALIREGWLEETEDGIEVPKFDEHMGKVGKQRALAARRQQSRRAKKTSRSRHAPSVTSSYSYSPSSQEEEVESATKRLSLEAALSVEIPQVLSGAVFEGAWRAWCRWKCEGITAKNGWRTNVGPTNQLVRLAALGPEKAAAAIRHSLANEWVGVHEAPARELSRQEERDAAARQVPPKARRKGPSLYQIKLAAQAKHPDDPEEVRRLMELWEKEDPDERREVLLHLEMLKRAD